MASGRKTAFFLNYTLLMTGTMIRVKVNPGVIHLGFFSHLYFRLNFQENVSKT